MVFVNIDSCDCDVIFYLKVSLFEVFLKKLFWNVWKVVLMLMELLNIDNVIKELLVFFRNNVILWVNMEDVDIGFFVYNVYVCFGIYSVIMF